MIICCNINSKCSDFSYSILNIFKLSFSNNCLNRKKLTQTATMDQMFYKATLVCIPKLSKNTFKVRIQGRVVKNIDFCRYCRFKITKELYQNDLIYKFCNR